MKDSRKLRYYRARKRNLFSNWSVTNWLILINVVFFFFGFVLLTVSENYIKYIAIQPNAFFTGFVWTLLTSMFMHGGPFHLFINMFVLFSLGNLCEKIIGRKRYLWFYLLSGIVAGIVFVLFAYFFGVTLVGEKIFGSPQDFAVGASGAIFAIAGLFMILTPRLRFMIIFLPFFSLPAYIMIPLVLFVTWIVSSSVSILAGVNVAIGNTAHFGGFLVGVVYGIYLRKKYKRKTRMIADYFSG